MWVIKNKPYLKICMYTIFSFNILMKYWGHHPRLLRSVGRIFGKEEGGSNVSELVAISAN